MKRNLFASIVSIFSMKSIKSLPLVLTLFLSLGFGLVEKTSAQCIGPYQGFDSFGTTTSRTLMINNGWAFSAAGVTPTTSAANARSGTNVLSLGNAAGNAATTPTISNPSEIKFYYRGLSATNTINVTAQWSTDNFSTIGGTATGVANLSYQSITINSFGGAASVKVRISITSFNVTAAALFVDDLSWTSTTSALNNIIVPELGNSTCNPVNVPAAGTGTYSFYDQGGLSDTYNKSQTQIVHFAPSVAGEKVKITFNSFAIDTLGGTNITVYNGNGATPGTEFTGLNAATTVTAGTTVTSTAVSGYITVRYVTTALAGTLSATTQPGFNTTVECISNPTITSLTGSGCAGGTLVIAGTNLGGATAVTVGGVAVSAIGANTATSLTVTPAPGSSGTVAVTTAAGSVTSSASYSANLLPTISSQPSSGTETLCVGGSATLLSVTAAAGSGTITTYQWYSNTSASTIGGVLVATNSTSATTNSFTPSTTTAGTLYYYVVVTNTNGCSVTSSLSGAITVNTSVTITSNPSSSAQTVCVGSAITPLSVTATGGGLSYQWYSNNTNSNVGGTLISGATAASYLPSNAVAMATTYYYCVVSNGTPCNRSVTSAVSGGITVNALPAAVTVSASGTYCTNTTLIATNGGSGTMYFQSTVSGGTFTFAPSTSQVISLSGTYYFRARSAAGCWGPEGSATVTILSVPVAPTANAATLPTSNSFSANWNGVGGATGYFLDVATDSGFTSFVTNYNNRSVGSVTTFSVTGLNPATTYYYRVRANNGACSGPSSNEITVATLPITYCTTSYTSGNSTFGDNITNVTLENLSNNSSTSNPPYTFFSNVTVPNLYQGATATISVSFGRDTFEQYVGVWIDYNKNGIFENSEGVVSINDAGVDGTVNLTLTIPAGALLGNTRMRVRGGDNDPLTVSMACGTTNSSFGETEDYIVNIINVPPCTVSLPTGLTSSFVTNTTATLSWSDASFAPSSIYEYALNTTTTRPSSGTLITGETSVNLTGLTANTTYYYWVRANCGGSNQSAWTGPSSFFTTAAVEVILNNSTTGGTSTTCNGRFYDSGGAAGNYSNNETYTYTFIPSTLGSKLKVVFNSCALQSNSDFLSIYNGTTVTAANLIGNYTGSQIAAGQAFISTAAGGELTFRFTSNGTGVLAGWDASITCVAVPRIDSFTPTRSCSGATALTVTITGTNFLGISAVKFNGVNASSFTVVNSTTITAVVPSVVTDGFITITNGDGTVTSTSAYTVVAIPVVTVSPSVSLCTGQSTTLTASGGLTYLWSPSTGLSNTTSASVTATPTTTTTYTVTGTSTFGCSASATTTVTVNPIIPASVSILSTATIICPGVSVTFTAIPTNGGTAPSYQWKVNGVNVGSNSTTFTSTTIANNDVVSVVMTTNESPCLSGSPATSNSITMTVNPILEALVIIGATGTMICSGTSVTFNATPINGGSAPSFQWKINGNNVGVNSPFYTTTTLANSDVVSVVMTSNASPCLTGSPATSNSITITVTPANTVTAASSTPTTCINTTLTTITHTTTRATGIGIATGLPAGVTATWATNTITISGTPTASGTFNYSIPLTGGCGTVNATGTIVINPNLPASVSIGASATTICSGNSVTFNATTTNGGASPSFQWKLNGVNVGTNSAIYTTTTLSNNDVVSLFMTSNANPCLTGSPATSNSITMFVDSIPMVTPASNQTFCASATVANLVATGTNIKWYTTATGGTALSSNSALVSGTYYVSQTVNGCESTRLPVSVIITSPTVPTFQQVPSTCSGSSINPLQTTSLNGITGTWSPVLNNTTTTTYTFTPIAGQCATTTNQTITITNPIVTSAISFVAPITTLSKVSNSPVFKSNTTQLRAPGPPPPLGLCPSPTNLIAFDITQTTANLSWVDNNYTTNFSWEIEVLPANSSPTGSGIVYVGNLPYSISELTAGTAYKYYVRTNCQYGNYSAWVGPYSFTTLSPPTDVQNLCAKTIQPYNVNVGDTTHNGSTYVWSITPGTPSAIITGNGTNAITIDWSNVPSGTYTIQTIETSIGGCVSIPVTAIINLTPTAIPVAQSQTFCASATVANLVATGTKIQWYASATGGTALSATTALVSGTYYLSQIVNGCESSRLPVSIVVTSPIVPAFQLIPSTCIGSSINPLPTTSLNGITGTWSPVLNNTTTTTYTFTPTAGQCATTTTQTITIITPKVTSQISFTDTITTLSKVNNKGTILKSNTIQLRIPPIPPPGCSAPDNLTANNVTQTTANLSWVDSNYSTTGFWEIEVISSGSLPTGLGAEYIGTLPYPITGLTAGTAYKYYVRARCFNSLYPNYAFYSDWVGPYSFTTSPPPTPTQNLCTQNIQPYNVNVGDATHNGSTYVWSISPSTSSVIITGNGTNAITIDWANVPSGTYTLQAIETSIDGCVSIPVTAIINLTPTALPVAQSQTFCTSATVANLVATGSNIQWYSAATGSSALTTTTALVSGTYFVSQTNNGCESYRLPVSMVVSSPTVPTFQQIASTCTGSSINPLPTTSNNGITGTWSPALNNTTTTTYTFTPTAGQCATTTTQTITITTPKVTSQISFGIPDNIVSLPSVAIGTQVWTNKNLDVTTYRDGTPIPQVINAFALQNLTTGAWCYVNNDRANGAIYGKLYNWYAVAGIYDTASLNSATLRKQLAPVGWHVPTYEEWNTVITFLGGINVAGGKMKSTGTTLWLSPNTDATNESGFTGLPGDGYYSSGSFGGWWSSSEYSARGAWSIGLEYNSGFATIDDNYKDPGLSVRFIRDLSLTSSSTQTLCVKSVQPYNVNIGDSSHNGSTYVWSISPSTPSAIITGNGTNAITIDWSNVPSGTYTLQAIETSFDGCISLPVTAIINLTPTALPIAQSQTFCNSATVANLVATGTNIQWYTSSTGGSALTTTTSLVTSTYYVSQTVNGCESERTSVPVTINPNLAASVSIGASTTIICSGTSISFTATPVNGGTSPSYQWQVNGVNVGTNNATYTTTTLSNNDLVSVIMTSNASPCLIGSPATSNSITMTVNPILEVLVFIGATGTTICSGTSVSFNATPINGGSAPTYQWKLNGNNVGVNSPFYTTTTLSNNDVVSLIMTSNASPCLTGSPATSNSITITVTPANTVTAASSTPTTCINTALSTITHTTTRATGIGIATGLPAGVTATWSTNIITISGTPTASGTFNYSIPLTGGCGTINATGTIVIHSNLTACESVVTVKMNIQGFTLPNGMMRPVLANQGVGSSSTDVDNVTIELHNTSVPFATFATTTAMLQTNGDAVATFSSAPVGSFYIVVRHRNSLETWSANPVTIGASSTYDFTDSASKAYGNNMILVGGKYSIYNGDLNQDGFVESGDYPSLYNDSDAGQEGYYSTDLNGDGFVESGDYPILFNNSDSGIEISRP